MALDIACYAIKQRLKPLDSAPIFLNLTALVEGDGLYRCLNKGKKRSYDLYSLKIGYYRPKISQEQLHLPKNTEDPLLVKLKPSKQLQRLLFAMHGLALGASIANALPIAAKSALLTGICIHLWFIAQRLKNAQCSIKHTEALGWAILTEDSGSRDFEPIEILNSTVITVFAVFLHFNKDAHKQSVLIVSDALSEDDYRRLIVRLKTTGNTKKQAC